jgi:hypothetical protein
VVSGRTSTATGSDIVDDATRPDRDETSDAVPASTG